MVIGLHGYESIALIAPGVQTIKQNLEARMDFSALTPLYHLFYAIGEILTTTWPGRLILGMVVGAMLTRFARS
jgi:hypothetical protein